MKNKRLWLSILLLLVTAAIFLLQSGLLTGQSESGLLDAGTTQTEPLPQEAPSEQEGESEESTVRQDAAYTSKEEVALYLYQYGELPENYLTKSEAEALGWVASKGNLWDVTDHGCIGGDRFGNREGLLPKASGRQWYECDVNYSGGYRGEERILYSSDGLIYYTGDHYASFTQLY